MQSLYNNVHLCDAPDLDNVERLDLGALPYIAACNHYGMPIDLDHFARMGMELARDMERITEDVRNISGIYCNLDSGDQVEHLLFQHMGLKQARVKYTKSKKRLSVDGEVLTAIQHEHEIIPRIMEYKELSKLKGTYVDPMPGLSRKTALGEWRMFPNLMQGRVPSGRLNCKDPNLLAMPTRTDRGREIRKGFIAPDGWCFVSVDESQIEMRMCAHCSGDPALIAAYDNGEDIYSDFAISAFQIPDTRYRDADGWHYPGVDKMEHRYPAKTCMLAAIYDVSPGGLLEQMPVICRTCHLSATKHTCDAFAALWTEDKCQDILNAFYFKYPGVITDRKRHHQRARQFGYIWDLWGRLLHVAAVRSVHPWVVSAALRETGNFPYQGGAQGTIKLVMAQAMDLLTEQKMLGDVWFPSLQVHDELLQLTREDVKEDVMETLTYLFETVCRLRVPIKAGASFAQSWGEIAK